MDADCLANAICHGAIGGTLFFLGDRIGRKRQQLKDLADCKQRLESANKVLEAGIVRRTEDKLETFEWETGDCAADCFLNIIKDFVRQIVKDVALAGYFYDAVRAKKLFTDILAEYRARLKRRVT